MSPVNMQSASCLNILETAESLVRQKGFGATTVDQICKASGVTKGAFFHYFKSKNELGLEMLRRVDEDLKNSPACCCESAPTDPLDRVMYAIDSMAEGAMDAKSKCGILSTFAQEMCGTDGDIAKLCQCICNSAVDDFKAIFQAAKDEYAPDREIDIDAMTETLFALRQGAAVMAKAQGSKDVIPQVYGSYKAMVRSIFQPDR